MAKIMVVDDESGMRKTLAMLLRRERHQVTETETVADAVGRLRGEPHDLVIADLRMEPLNGFDLLNLVRADDPMCPVIIMTAFGTPEARSQAMRLGAADFLDKPLRTPAFLERVREIVPAAAGV
jgi:DNA-binding NtrC family response regulator